MTQPNHTEILADLIAEIDAQPGIVAADRRLLVVMQVLVGVLDELEANDIEMQEMEARLADLEAWRWTMTGDGK